MIIATTLLLSDSNTYNKLHDKYLPKYTKNNTVFDELPKQESPLENSQINILFNFASNILSQSKDLESEIVDMVNQNFWDLI